MDKTNPKISILAVFILLCGGAFSADNAVEGYPDWWQKRYAPELASIEKLISLEKDYFAGYFEAQAKISPCANCVDKEPFYVDRESVDTDENN